MDRRLKQFLAVAETGNVSAAADLLHVTQPTVSVNINKLEQEHGVQLFQRSSRGMTLTDFGELLCEHAKVMARIEENANTEIRLLKASQEKAVRIGTGFSWWSLFVRDLVSEFQRSNPGNSIHVEVSSSLDGLRNLMIGDIEFFLGTKVDGLSGASGFTFQQMFEVSDGYYVGRHHPLNGRPCCLSDLANYPKISVSAFGNRHIGIVDLDDLDPSFSRSTSNVSGWISTNSMHAGIDLLNETDAILTYPLPTKRFFEKAGVVLLNVEDDDPQSVPIGLYSLAKRAAEGRAKNLSDALKARCADQTRWTGNPTYKPCTSDK